MKEKLTVEDLHFDVDEVIKVEKELHELSSGTTTLKRLSFYMALTNAIKRLMFPLYVF